MEIEFYETVRGACPVKSFLDNRREVPDKAKKKIMKKIDKLVEYGVNHLLRTKDAEKLTDGLLELRIETQKCWYRLIFTVFLEKCYFLSAFKKKSNKTPLKEIDKAESLRQQLLLQYSCTKSGMNI